MAAVETNVVAAESAEEEEGDRGGTTIGMAAAVIVGTGTETGIGIGIGTKPETGIVAESAGGMTVIAAASGARRTGMAVEAAPRERCAVRSQVQPTCLGYIC